MLLLGLGRGGDQLIGGRLSVRMGKDLHIIGIGPFHRLENLGIGHGRVADIARRKIADGCVIGPVAPGGEGLGRAVDRQLDAADPEPLVISAAGIVLDIRAVGGEIGIGHHVDLDLAFRGHLFQHGINGLARPAFLRGRVSEGRPQLGSRLRQCLHARRTDTAQKFGNGLEPGLFLKHAAWLLAAGLAVYRTARRVRGVGGDPHKGQGLGIERAHMA